MFLVRVGAGGGVKNVIRTAAMPKSPVFTVLLPLCTTCCARMWSKPRSQNIHAFGDHAENTGMYRIVDSWYNILLRYVEQDALSQASMPLTCNYITFASSYNILCKDVEQDALS